MGGYIELANKYLAGDVTERTVYASYNGIQFATLTEYMNDACEVAYVWRVDWDAYDRINDPNCIIIGVDLSLRKEEYIRNHIPSFIYSTIPPEGREDIPDILAKGGLREYDVLDILIAFGHDRRDNIVITGEIKYPA